MGYVNETRLSEILDRIKSYVTTQNGETITAIQTKYGQKGLPYGVASLGADGKVPSTQLPSFVDDVLEGYLRTSNFYTEETGGDIIAAEKSKIYVDLKTGKTYRWGGSSYVEISESLAVGTTADSAYSGASGVALEGRVKNAETNITSIISTITDTRNNYLNKSSDDGVTTQNGHAISMSNEKGTLKFVQTTGGNEAASLTIGSGVVTVKGTFKIGSDVIEPIKQSELTTLLNNVFGEE